jgi:signal transduction histidine kinase
MMTNEAIVFFFLCFASLLMSLLVAGLAWRQRRFAGAGTFAALSLFQAIWTLGYINEMLSQDLAGKAFWDAAQSIGIFSIPAAMYIFAREYGRANLRRVGWRWAALLAVPVIYTAILYLDPFGPLSRINTRLVPPSPQTPFGALQYDYPNALYWVVIYSYLLTFTSFVLLGRRIIISRGVFRWQMIWVSVGLALPVAISFITVFVSDFEVLGQRDISPLSFGFSGLIVLATITRYRLFDLVPVARERVAEVIRDGVLTLDAQQRIVDFNPAARQMLGLHNSHIGQPVMPVLPWMPLDKLEQDHVFDVQLGSTDLPLYYTVSITPLKDGSADHSGTLILVRDVTARARAEKAVQSQNQRLETMAEIARRMTLAQDEQQLLDALSPLRFAKPPLHLALSYSREVDDTLVGVDLVAMRGSDGKPLPLEGVPTYFPIEQLGNVLASADPTFTGNVLTAPGLTDEARAAVLTFGYYAQIIVPLRSAGRLQGLLAFSWSEVQEFDRDLREQITELAPRLADNILARRTFIQVQKARAELETLYREQVEVAEKLRAVDTMKSQFLASMSHELRTPLNAILNFTEFVALGMLGPVNDAQVDALNKTIDSGRHLLSLINDVLDMTKIESGMMKLFVESDIDLKNELNTVIATAESLLAEKPEVHFVRDIDADLPALLGDRRRIRQVLLNLLSNAAKFTEEGSVTLSVKHRGGEVLFAVIDTGPGIAEQDYDVIFEPFRQTETGIRHAGGTGLGLPISKRLVEAHGGRLWVESAAGEGAAFYFTIPIEAPALKAQLLESVEA